LLGVVLFHQEDDGQHDCTQKDNNFIGTQIKYSQEGDEIVL